MYRGETGESRSPFGQIVTCGNHGASFPPLARDGKASNDRFFQDLPKLHLCEGANDGSNSHARHEALPEGPE